MNRTRHPLGVLPPRTALEETRARDGELPKTFRPIKVIVRKTRHRREADDNLSAGASCPGQTEDKTT